LRVLDRCTGVVFVDPRAPGSALQTLYDTWPCTGVRQNDPRAPISPKNAIFVRFFEKDNAMARKLIVGITQGDGNGVGYEVIIKALADERILELCTPVIYGSSKIFGFYKKQIHDIDNINTNVISTAKDVHQKRVNIVNCLPMNSGRPGPTQPPIT
jgi:hypothetical protein